MLLVLAGMVVLSGSVAGFLWASAALDERIAVVVAGRDLAEGDVLAPHDLQAALVSPGSVPHLVWDGDIASALAGLALDRPLAAGALVTADMLAEPSAGAFGDRLEVHVPVDVSLAPQGLAPGDVVLLVDPGVPPTSHETGRARQVIEILQAELLEGTTLRLFAPPAAWVGWQTLSARLGGLPMVVPVPLGGDPETLAARLDAVWAAQHQQAQASRSLLGPKWSAAARPGLLGTVVAVDASLSASGIAEGDTALLVDPGAAPGSFDEGRPRAVLRSVRLDHYRDGLLGVWAEPDEWVWWQNLPRRLGAAPMLLRVHPDTDTARISIELNDVWHREWEQQR